MLEYPIDYLPPEYNLRYVRWSRSYALNPNPNPELRTLPFVMVGSGFQIDYGYNSYAANKAAYKAMIDAELARSPQMAIDASWEQVGNHFNFLVDVTNQSGVDLTPDYDINVFALVYEDVTPDPKPPLDNGDVIFHLNHYVRGVTYQAVTSTLKNGVPQTFYLPMPDLVDITKYQNRPINWSKLHGLVFVDYRPGKTKGKYDMLQVVKACPPSTQHIMWADRQSLTFLQDRSKPTNPTEVITVNGFPSTLTWEATSSQPWLEVTPAGGGMGSQITASLNITGMDPGTYNAEIRVSAVMPEPNQELVLPVQLILMDSLNYAYMPIIGGPPLRK